MNEVIIDVDEKGQVLSVKPTTPNYNLVKPNQEDFYDVEDHNGNMDIIDTELKSQSEQIQNCFEQIEGVKEDVAGLDVSWDGITGKPPAFPPSTHQHAIADVTGLQTALDGKSPVHTHPYAPSSHTTDKNNPHGVTKAQVGLGNVPNYPATGATNDVSDAKLATAGAVKKSFDKGVEALSKANQAYTLASQSGKFTFHSYAVNTNAGNGSEYTQTVMNISHAKGGYVIIKAAYNTGAGVEYQKINVNIDGKTTDIRGMFESRTNGQSKPPISISFSNSIVITTVTRSTYNYIELHAMAFIAV